MDAWIAISTTSQRSLTGMSEGHGYDSGVPLCKEQGVVLRSVKLGEADKIVTVMTLGSGKVRAVAKGIRKTTSRFGARLGRSRTFPSWSTGERFVAVRGERFQVVQETGARGSG
jgi:hypothetical protein